MLPLPAAGAGATGDTTMSSTQLIEQCATRLRGIVEALDNIHDNTPHRWSTDLDDVHSSAESLLAMINDQASNQADLAQPSPKCTTCGGAGMVDDGEITCSEGGIPYENGPVKCVKDCPSCKAHPSPTQPEDAPVIGCLCGMPMTEGHHSPDGCCNLEEFAPSPAQSQAEGFTHFPEPLESVQQMDAMLKAEAERPEVVAWRYGFSGEIVSDKACLDEWKSGGEYQSLMTVAQHERIAASHWERAMDLMGEHVARISEKFKAERDAALARVAEGWKLVPSDKGCVTSSMKAECIGEFSFYIRAACAECLDVGTDSDCHVCGGDIEYDQKIDVPWDTCKEIYKAMLAAAPGKEVPQAWLDVQAERSRQITAEGWTPEHDDAHSHGQMARAAACYALAGSSAPNDGTAALLVSLAWPWDEQWWKPTSARRDLIKACALTLAEIERLDRATAGGDA